MYMCLAWFTIALGIVCLDTDKVLLLLIFKVLRTDQTLLDSMSSTTAKTNGGLLVSEVAPSVLCVEKLEAELAHELLGFHGIYLGAVTRERYYISD